MLESGERELVVRAAVTDMVTAYAMALDARDWRRFRDLFEDEVEIDYGSLGSLKATIPADDWAARCRVLGFFGATQHKVSNFVCEFPEGPDGGLATVTSYVDASHFVEDRGRSLCGIAQGTYVHHLARGPGGWKIRKCVFTLLGCPGGRDAFDAAFAVARERFAASQQEFPG